MLKTIIKTLYFPFAHRYLLYGICILISSGAGNVNRIKTMQNKVFTLFFPNHEDSDFFFRRNRIFWIEKMFAFYVSLKFHKYLNSTANLVVKFFLEELIPRHGHQTHFVVQGNITLLNRHSSELQHSFIFGPLGIWNK